MFVTACTSTKMIKYTTFPRIASGEEILMMAIKNLSVNQQYSLFQTGSKIMSKSNKMKFIFELEYDLASEGIGKEQFYRDSVPDSIISILATKTNSRYILFVEVISSKKGNIFGFYSSPELDRFNSHNQDNETNSASLLFRIIDTKFYLTESKYQINTNIGPLSINNEKKGETRINLTTELSAITAAFEKGMKQLKKGVINLR